VATIPLGVRLLTRSSGHTRGSRAGNSILLFGLAPDGVWHARPITRPPVSSYLTFSPLPIAIGLARKAVSEPASVASRIFKPLSLDCCAKAYGMGGIFSVPLSADHSALSLAAILPYEARTFLP
jgi:hypothetical protein